MAMLLTWDQDGERYYQNGIDRVVLFKKSANGTYPLGVNWNGVTAVNANPEGAEQTELWADNSVYGVMISPEKFNGSIEAYDVPKEFLGCMGAVETQAGMVLGQQARSQFGLCYRTRINNDVQEDVGYRLHFVWNASASPSESPNATINDSPEGNTYSFDFKCSSTPVTGYKPAAYMYVDSIDLDPAVLTALETIIYGDDVGPTDPRLPLPDEIIALS